MGQELLKKAYYFTGLFAFIVMLLFAAGYFYVILKLSPRLTWLKPAGYNEAISNSVIPQDPNKAMNPTSSDTNVKSVEESSKTSTEAKVSPEYYLGEITNFYGNVIVILFSTIGILLAISFIYVYTVSRGKAEDLARQALTEESFQITLNDRIEKALAQLKTEGDIADWLDKTADFEDEMAEFEERIDFLEKVVTKVSYEKQSGTSDKLEGGNPNGGNKTI